MWSHNNQAHIPCEFLLVLHSENLFTENHIYFIWEHKQEMDILQVYPGLRFWQCDTEIL